jgi:predicted AlkP superfamily pyrophosphatase or phosphodiesterase
MWYIPATMRVLARRLFVLLWAVAAPVVNAQSQQDKPYVLLISLDGFRYDYAERYGATNLLQLARNGVAAKALIPSFPTNTFPNHYTIVTGLYPAHHRIVENVFWDWKRQAEFSFHDPQKTSDGAWWGGAPLWVLAEQQGMRTASMFWPGSDVEIQHTRPTYFYHYDGKITNEQRIAQVLAWLKLPKAERPHFITLYFSDVDHEAHTFGPDAPETRHAVQDMDGRLGRLFREIDRIGVPVNIIVVSDHGMTAVTGDIDLTKLANFEGVRMEVNATDVKLYSRDAVKLDQLYAQLHGKDDRFEAYRPSDIPARLHYSGDERIGDLLLLALKPVVLHRPRREDQTPQKGMHGYDVALVPDMRGIFFARGPNLKRGVTIAEFENIHIFPLIANILGLEAPASVDGKLSVLAPVLVQKRVTSVK